MAAKFMKMVVTPAVQRAQDTYFGRHHEVGDVAEKDLLTAEEVEFIASRDSFYIASVSESGWPYVQHRGGPVGFVRVLGPNLLGFADFKGNRQLLTTGNLTISDRVCLFMMDYSRRERLKMLGHARVLDAREHPELVEQLAPENLRSRVERLFLVEIDSYDWNCPQYITPRFTADEVDQLTVPLRVRIAELEAKVASCEKSIQSTS
jgi:predicted pyridoxine 5'-phosphate oxidase superfamily flavin-nucleotide-binding protein